VRTSATSSRCSSEKPPASKSPGNGVSAASAVTATAVTEDAYAGVVDRAQTTTSNQIRRFRIAHGGSFPNRFGFRTEGARPNVLDSFQVGFAQAPGSVPSCSLSEQTPFQRG